MGNKMDILEELKNNGFRITPARKGVFKELLPLPRTVEEIYSSLKEKNIKIDLASVYRNIQLFIRQGVVHEVDFGDGKKRYEPIKKDNHHHHLICENCGSIEDIPLNEKFLINQVEKKTDFKVQGHFMEFFGHCMNCQYKK